jgi:hypothetical protein
MMICELTMTLAAIEPAGLPGASRLGSVPRAVVAS